MLMSAIIGISIASYIRLGLASQKISNRALYNNGAINLAENGMEEAMYSINQMVQNASYAWPGWTTDGTASNSSAWRKWTNYTFDQNARGTVRVYIYNYTGVVAPRIVARSTVTLGGATSAPIEKWIEIALSKTSKFSNGLVAKQTITFNGNNATVDSWNSDPDNNPATAAVGYGAGTKRDNGSVGSISVAVGAIGVNNADIFGYAATGGSAVTVGPQGKVGPFGTADGTVAPGHTSTDFSASFEAVNIPAAIYTPIAAITDNITLPGAIAPAADGKYYVEATQINFNNKALTISAGKEVILKLTDTTTGISIGGGSGAINIAATGKLQIYTAGSISIAGNGVLNGGSTDATANQPINFQLYGTKTSGTQNISISGNGVLNAIVYAPQGSVTINGGGNSGNVSGSIVANDITLNGSVKFHYDESLANMNAGSPFRVVAWRELTSAIQRSAYSGVLSF
jgi:hypothetical protein